MSLAAGGARAATMVWAVVLLSSGCSAVRAAKEDPCKEPFDAVHSILNEPTEDSSLEELLAQKRTADRIIVKYPDCFGPELVAQAEENLS